MSTVTDVILASTLAATWLAAGLLADTLPTAVTALELRRRAGAVGLLVGLGAAILVTVPLLGGLLPGASSAPAAALLPAVPALVVLTATVRRLAQVRAGAGAIASAPLPPALRAAAAHPLIGVPLQITGLAAVLGLPIAARLVPAPGADVTGVAITLVGVAVLIIGIRAAMRHSRLSLLVLAPIGRRRR